MTTNDTLSAALERLRIDWRGALPDGALVAGQRTIGRGRHARDHQILRLGPDGTPRWAGTVYGKILAAFVAEGHLWALDELGGGTTLRCWNDATGAVVGSVLPPGAIRAVRLARLAEGVIEVWTWDVGGHPTDRGTWHVTARLDGTVLARDAVGQGQLDPPDGWAWRA